MMVDGEMICETCLGNIAGPMMYTEFRCECDDDEALTADHERFEDDRERQQWGLGLWPQLPDRLLRT